MMITREAEDHATKLSKTALSLLISHVQPKRTTEKRTKSKQPNHSACMQTHIAVQTKSAEAPEDAFIHANLTTFETSFHKKNPQQKPRRRSFNNSLCFAAKNSSKNTPS